MLHFEMYQVESAIVDSARGILANRDEGQWRWRLRSGNNEPIASGEAYKNKADCLKAINLLKSTDASTPVKEV